MVARDVIGRTVERVEQRREYIGGEPVMRIVAIILTGGVRVRFVALEHPDGCDPVAVAVAEPE